MNLLTESLPRACRQDWTPEIELFWRWMRFGSCLGEIWKTSHEIHSISIPYCSVQFWFVTRYLLWAFPRRVTSRLLAKFWFSYLHSFILSSDPLECYWHLVFGVSFAVLLQASTESGDTSEKASICVKPSISRFLGNLGEIEALLGKTSSSHSEISSVLSGYQGRTFIGCLQARNLGHQWSHAI